MSQIFKSLADLAKNEVTSPIYICRPDGVEALMSQLSAFQKTFAQDRSFAGEAGQTLRVPGPTGKTACVLFGAGSKNTDALGPIRLGGLSANLPEGLYTLGAIPADWDRTLCPIGWGLGTYKFEQYLKTETHFPTLCLDEKTDHMAEADALTTAIGHGRDHINTPAGDLGPVALHAAAVALANRFDAQVTETIGEDLLVENYPMIHAVGRAAHETPRLIEFEWGDPSHPRLAVIGKGITFDTGGLNIKGASGARLMKKDMGGAAHALALAEMIMANDLPIRLHCLVAIAENAISAGAYRPGDILPSRTGLTVEIDNTDAEGRLVLGDALCKAAEADPVLMIDFATLTGAARVALGPTLPPFFCNRKGPIEAVLLQGEQQHDPVWNMPLWQPYMSLLSSPIADMKNSGGSFAGCITAALFLERFVKDKPWMHFDVYGWNPTGGPAHPKGGEMFALRTLYHWLKDGGLDSDFST